MEKNKRSRKAYTTTELRAMSADLRAVGELIPYGYLKVLAKKFNRHPGSILRILQKYCGWTGRTDHARKRHALIHAEWLRWKAAFPQGTMKEFSRQTGRSPSVVRTAILAGDALRITEDKVEPRPNQ